MKKIKIEKITSTHSAYGLFYAIAVLLGVIYISLATIRTQGTQIDRLLNTHIAFQSSLFVQSLAEIATLCLQEYDFTHCQSDFFTFGRGFSGGYDLKEDKNGENRYYADIYVEAKNLRNAQMLRTTAEVFVTSVKIIDKDLSNGDL